MTAEEQAIADKIGHDVVVQIDRNGMTDITTVALTYTLRLGVTMPKGNHDHDEAAAHLKRWLAERLDEQSGEFA